MLPRLHLPEWSVTLVIALVVLGFPIAVFMGWVFDVGPHGIERTTPAAIALAAAASFAPAPLAAHVEKAPVKPRDERRSIAVLPFVNMSGDPENEYFSDGISEEILNLLTKLPQLKVSSRTSSFVFKGKEVSIPTVVKELGVSTVLEGSVRRAGDHVRITAQLIETDSDSHLWSETYDREMKDVFAIQDDIARSIAERCKWRSDGAAACRTLPPPIRRPMASISRAPGISTPSRAAISCRQHVRDRRCGIRRGARGAGRRLRSARPLQRVRPGRGVDEGSGQRRGGGDARREFRRGTHVARYGHVHQRAVRRRRKTIRDSDPDQPEGIRTVPVLGRACLAEGNFEKAARLFIRAQEVNPSDYQAPSFLAMVYRSMGRMELARQADAHTLEVIERHVAMNPDDARALCFGASALAAQGQRDKAIEWAEAALESRENEPHFLYNTGCTFAELGDSARALDLLERAVDLGWGHRAWIEHDSDLASLRDNPRFVKLLDRMH
jgi:adenylate cyclase